MENKSIRLYSKKVRKSRKVNDRSRLKRTTRRFVIPIFEESDNSSDDDDGQNNTNHSNFTASTLNQVTNNTLRAAVSLVQMFNENVERLSEKINQDEGINEEGDHNNDSNSDSSSDSDSNENNEEMDHENVNESFAKDNEEAKKESEETDEGVNGISSSSQEEKVDSTGTEAEQKDYDMDVVEESEAEMKNSVERNKRSISITGK